MTQLRRCIITQVIPSNSPDFQNRMAATLPPPPQTKLNERIHFSTPSAVCIRAMMQHHPPKLHKMISFPSIKRRTEAAIVASQPRRSRPFYRERQWITTRRWLAGGARDNRYIVPSHGHVTMGKAGARCDCKQTAWCGPRCLALQQNVVSADETLQETTTASSRDQNGPLWGMRGVRVWRAARACNWGGSHDRRWGAK